MLSAVIIFIFLAPFITCSFVTTCPLLVTITPEPLPKSVFIVTTESLTDLYMSLYEF